MAASIGPMGGTGRSSSTCNRSGERKLHDLLRVEAQRTYPNVERVLDLGDEAYLWGRTELSVVSGDTVVWVGAQFYQRDAPAVLYVLAQIGLARS